MAWMRWAAVGVALWMGACSGDARSVLGDGGAGTDAAMDAGRDAPDGGPQDSSTRRDGGGDALYDLGPLPAELQDIQWPEPPTTTREVEVTTAEEFEREAAVEGTRIRVTADIDQLTFINASHIDIEMSAEGRLREVHINNRLSHIRFRGGRYGVIWFEIPGTFVPTPEFHPEWLIADVLIDGAEIEASDSGMLIRGRRVAVLNTNIHAVRYSLWCGDTDTFRSEDLIIAGNRMRSDGPESTLRLVDAYRTVTVENVLENTTKHSYRVHNTSDLNFAARNTLINTGTMIGTQPWDTVGTQWFDDNVFYHAVPSLGLFDRNIETFFIRRNTVYTDQLDCLVCEPPFPPGWTVEGNVVEPYRPPPNGT